MFASSAARLLRKCPIEEIRVDEPDLAGSPAYSTHRRGNAAFSEADSPSMAAEPHSSPRGRPPVFSEESLRQAAGYSYARRIATRRGAQDLVYRMFAVAVLEHYCEAYPEKAETLGWLLWPKRRHTLLTELGRVARPRSDTSGNLGWSEEDVSTTYGSRFRFGGSQAVDETRSTDDAGLPPTSATFPFRSLGRLMRASPRRRDRDG